MHFQVSQTQALQLTNAAQTMQLTTQATEVMALSAAAVADHVNQLAAISKAAEDNKLNTAAEHTVMMASNRDQIGALQAELSNLQLVQTAQVCLNYDTSNAC